MLIKNTIKDIQKLEKGQAKISKEIADLKPELDSIKEKINKMETKNSAKTKVSGITDSFECVVANQPYKLVKLFAGMSLSITSRATGTDYICVGFSSGECTEGNYKLFIGDSTTLSLSGIWTKSNSMQVWVSSNVANTKLSYLILSAEKPLISVED